MAEHGYECGTCGSGVLHIMATTVRDVEKHTTTCEWVLSCDEGHVLIPVPGEDYVIGPCE